jgi:ribosomal protein L32
MKLYTEEQLKLFYQLGKFDGIARRENDVEEEIKNHLPIELPSDSLCINCDESKSTHNVCMDCIIKIGRQNIQLPSDEEIEQESNNEYQEQKQSYENSVEMFPIDFANYLKVGFIDGAKWMRDKIRMQGR